MDYHPEHHFFGIAWSDTLSVVKRSEINAAEWTKTFIVFFSFLCDDEPFTFVFRLTS